MSTNVKISPAPPFGLPAAATLTGAELVPMDQTTAGITTTVKASVSAIIALAAGGVTSFNTRTGAVTLTSGDVTTALGYVPLSSFNGRTGPAITLTSGDVTTALGFTPGTSSAVGATPTALVGLTAIAGTSGNFTRSDGAPAINQGISPNWTGTHTYSGGGGIGTLFANSIGIGFKDTGGATNTELQLFSDNQVYLDNHSSGAAINLRVGPGFAGLHVNLFGVQLDAPQTAGGDTLAVTANADLTGVMINGSTNNIGLTINNGQSGATTNWRIMSSATGSGFGAGNLVIGRGSSRDMWLDSGGAANFSDQVRMRNTQSLQWSDTSGTEHDVLFLFSDNNLYMDNGAAGSINLRTAASGGAIMRFTIDPNGHANFSNPSAAGDTVVASQSTGHAAYTANMGGSGNYGLFVALNGTSAVGLLASQSAATAANIYSVAQSGQNTWTHYQPASSNDLRWFDGSSDRVVLTNAGTALVVNGIASNYAFQASGVSTGNGVRINAGNAFAQAALNVDNFNATAQLFQVHGDGTVEVGGPSGGALGAGWMNAASGYAINGAPIYSGAPVGTSLAAGSATLVLSDANRQIQNFTGAARTATIPANSSVAMPVGSMITFVNGGAGVLSIAINTDTLVFAPSGATGTRSLATNGLATAIKSTTTQWNISGAGLT